MDTFFGVDLGTSSPVDLGDLTVNLALGAMLASLLALHYVRFGHGFGNRVALARVFVILTVVTVFMITLAKSSLAISLGLLGAVSMIRFRTPIKEPEELAYLFFAVGIGIGLGANARLPTLFAFALIVALLTLRSVRTSGRPGENLYLTVEVPSSDDTKGTLDAIQRVLQRHTERSDMRRLDVRAGNLHATFRVDCPDKQRLTDLVEELSRAHGDAIISFVEQPGGIGS